MKTKWRFFLVVGLTLLLVTSAGCADGPADREVDSPSTPGPSTAPDIAMDLELVGRWPHGSCNTVLADGDYVYIGSGGLVIIADMTDPTNPAEVSRIVTPGAVWKIFRSGDYLYVADKLAGLRIIDISIPSSPVEVGSFEKEHWLGARDVYVFDSYAYVAMGDTYILDVSNPSNPVEIGRAYDEDELLDYVFDVDVSGSYAYLTTDDGTDDGDLRILDIGDPTNPVPVSRCLNLGFEARVDVSDGYAYVTDTHNGLYIIDVNDPSNPVEVAHLYRSDWVWDVNVSGSYAYVATFDGFFILNVSDPSNPVEIGSYVYDGDERSDWEDLYVYGSYAYVTWSYGGLKIFDISEPSNPVKAGSLATSGSAFDVFVAGDYAYIANDDFHILDISDPSNPLEVGGVYTPQAIDASAVYVSGSYAYVSGHTGLRIFDVGDPTNPEEVSSILSMQGDVRYQGIYVSGHYAYFLRYAYGLRILDVSDPSNPVEVSSFNIPDDRETRAVYVSDSYAYVTYGSDDEDQFRGLRILDVSDPSNPVEVASFETPENANGVCVSDGYAYLTWGDSLHIIDVSDPSNPVEVSYYPMGGILLEVYVHDGHAYVACRWCGLRVVDIRDPLNPMEVGRVDEVEPWGVHVSHSYICVVDMDYGIYVLRNST